MTASQRAKGCRGESEAALLLGDRDFTVVQTGRGRACEDMMALKDGRRYAVEVKNQKGWRIEDWRRQAKAQAKKAKADWMLMCRIPGKPRTFYVETEEFETVWKGI